MQKITNQEYIIMIFFVVTLILSSVYVVFDREVIDIVYFGVLLYYFIKFLIIKYKR